MNNNPIGIFDSGVGGLSVARSIREKLPNEDMVYIADSLNAPYGNKSDEFISMRSSYIIDHLIGMKAKAVVVACNTATVSAIDMLRNNYSIPIIGVEPGIKPAVAASKSGTIGVLATEQTVNSVSFQNLVNRFSDEAHIETQSCPGLVELMETHKFEGHEIRYMLERYVMPLLEKGADTIVMGCTHFAFLTKILREIIGSELKIINTYQAVAIETSRQLNVNNLLTSNTKDGDTEFLSSNVHEKTALLFEKLWGEPVIVSGFA
ncbi:glutamate racemase [Desulfobacula sp.]|uniref:glutamate racemase n=1 Tax=Desulfobacula sp. TaxID=2593537 RepID=UPI00260E6055|nr:glutamate racemase [Desulfobacula sp.]